MERPVDPAGLHGATHALAKRRGKPDETGEETWGLGSCDYFVNNAYQARAHATMLYTKMPDTLLGTVLVSTRARCRVRESGKEEKEERGAGDICIRLCTRVGIYVHTCHPLRRLRVHMRRRRVCRAAAWLATHTEIRGHKCRWDLLMQLGNLSCSIHREMHEITIRTLFEMNFIRAARSRDDTRVNTRKEAF